MSVDKILFDEYLTAQEPDQTVLTLFFDDVLTEQEVRDLVTGRTPITPSSLIVGARCQFLPTPPSTDVTFYERTAPYCWAVLHGGISKIPVSHEEEIFLEEPGTATRYVVADPDLEDVEAGALISAPVKLMLPATGVLWKDPTANLGPEHSSAEEVEAFEGFLRMLREHPDAAVLVDRLRRLGFVQGIDRVKISLTFPRDEE
jgi:hypothetical protein